MTPRPIHRWKTLWLGLFIIAFLCWAWITSIDRYQSHAAHFPHGWIALAHYDGRVGLLASRSERNQWDYEVDDVKQSAGAHFHLRESWEDNVSEWGILTTTHHHLILAFTIPWLAFLAWRSLRPHPVTSIEK